MILRCGVEVEVKGSYGQWLVCSVGAHSVDVVRVDSEEPRILRGVPAWRVREAWPGTISASRLARGPYVVAAVSAPRRGAA